MNNSTQERGVWGALWHIAWTNLPAARGSAEWTQLGGWCGARAGAPWRQTDTAKELRQRKKKSTAHKHSNTHSHVLPFRFHTLVFPFLIKERRVPVKDMPPPGASCSSCRLRVCVSLVFLLCFFFFPDFLFLASVALLRVHVHAVSPPPPPPLQWQGHPIAPDGPPASPTYPTLPSWEVDLVTALKKQMASQPPDNSAQTHSGRSGKFSGQSGALLQLSRI